MKVKLGGKDVKLALTFNAAEAIADEICDPFEIVREEMTKALLLQSGVGYEPKFKFTIRNVPEILFIGHKWAEGELSRDDIRGLVMASGLSAAQEAAATYLASMMNNESEEASTLEPDAPEKK